MIEESVFQCVGDIGVGWSIGLALFFYCWGLVVVVVNYDYGYAAFRELLNVSSSVAFRHRSVHDRRELLGDLVNVVEDVLPDVSLVSELAALDNAAGNLFSGGWGRVSVLTFFVELALRDSVVVARESVNSLLWGLLPQYGSVETLERLELSRGDLVRVVADCERLVPVLLKRGCAYGRD